jgi:UrcA family protein
MRITAKLPTTAWPAVFAIALAPGCVASAPPDSLTGGAARAAPAALTAAPGSTQGGGSSIRIAYHDLDLATPEGIAALYVRIRRAAAEVCDANRPVTGTRMVQREAEACVRRSVVATVRQIGAPGLAALDLEQQALGEETPPPRAMCETPVRARIII